jgi:alkylation response protein AidB-like acyl-CoA dehydrogenase
MQMPVYQPKYLEHKEKLRAFIANEVLPHAQQFDSDQEIPRSFFMLLAKQGYLGSNIKKIYGGQELDDVALGILHEEFGLALCSLENALTVYGMVSKPLVRFGSVEQKQHWLPKIASGETIVALALTEPNIGSDLNQIETKVKIEDEYFLLNGTKKYITLGQIADLFLVLAKCEDKHLALLVERNTLGLEVKPITDILGLRSNMLAEITFQNCQIPKANLIGKIGTGLSHIISCALDEGRFTTAWGCIGLGQACLDALRVQTESRKQGGSLLKDHQIIQKILTEVIVNLKAARELCFNAANLRLNGEVSAIAETLVAKYFSSQMAVMAANHALQVFAGAGFTKEHIVERLFRDSKAMEIIEGASQIYEITVPKVCHE